MQYVENEGLLAVLIKILDKIFFFEAREGNSLTCKKQAH